MVKRPRSEEFKSTNALEGLKPLFTADHLGANGVMANQWSKDKNSKTRGTHAGALHSDKHFAYVCPRRSCRCSYYCCYYHCRCCYSAAAPLDTTTTTIVLPPN